MTIRKRIEWVDIVKFFGIFAIYLGHFGESAGPAYRFVFIFHVPLFFFISGCMNWYDNEKSIPKYIWKKVKTLLLPLYGFAMLSIIFNVLMNNIGFDEIKHNLICVLKGCIRNTFFAGGLWFLSCLFLMEIVFKFLKLLKYRFLILSVSIVLFGVAEFAFNPSPLVEPHMLYNFDSMCYYMVFFALGYCAYPYIEKLFVFDKPYKKVIHLTLLFVTMAYTALLFGGKNLLGILSQNAVVASWGVNVYRLLIIAFVILVSKLLEGAQLMSEIGKETLYLCGNEWIVKKIFPLFLSVFGLSVDISNPLVAYIYTFVLLMINIKIIIPVEKKIISILGSNIK